MPLAGHQGVRPQRSVVIHRLRGLLTHRRPCRSPTTASATRRVGDAWAFSAHEVCVRLNTGSACDRTHVGRFFPGSKRALFIKPGGLLRQEAGRRPSSPPRIGGRYSEPFCRVTRCCIGLIG
jgi:hypothetical protein